MILSRRRTDIQAYIQSISFIENKTYDFFLFLYSMVGFQTKTTDQPTVFRAHAAGIQDECYSTDSEENYKGKYTGGFLSSKVDRKT